MKESATYSGNQCVTDLLEQVAEREGVEPRELPPLYNTLDPDYLHQLLVTAQGPVEVRFTYCGYLVTVSDTDEVQVVEKTDLKYIDND